jgi:hypothetical protein
MSRIPASHHCLKYAATANSDSEHAASLANETRVGITESSKLNFKAIRIDELHGSGINGQR